jgi:hypothetical protein
VARRSLIVWLVVLPLAIAGTQVAHALAYRLATREAGERARELSATGHAYLSYLPLALAVGTVVVALALAVEVRFLVVRAPGVGPRPGVWGFALLAPAIFACQEHFERLVHAGAFPWDAAGDPTFLVGLALQLPFAVAAYAVARLLLRAARSLGGLLGRPYPRPRTDVQRVRPATLLSRPRVAALALGYGSRGPPVLPGV